MRKGSTGSKFGFSILKRTREYILPYKKVFLLSVFLTVLLAFIAPVRPWLIQYTFDKYIVQFNSSGLLTMILLLIAFLIFHALVQYSQTYLTNLLGQSIIRDMRINLFRHILQFRLKYFDNTPLGNLITRIISDMETVAEIFSEGLLVIIGDILQLVVVIVVMFYTSLQLTLVCLLTVPLLIIASNMFKNGIKSTFQEVRTQVAHLNTFVQEHLTGISVVQIFNREEMEMEKFKAINTMHSAAHIRSVWYYSIFFPIVEVLLAVSIAMLIWWGTKGIIQGQTTIGMLVAFILYINMLFRPIRELADKFNTLQMGIISSERIFKIMDTNESIENKGTYMPEKIKGEIVFKNVWFAYNENKRTEEKTARQNNVNVSDMLSSEWVLKNVSFKLEAGKSLALVGATGAGKTSVINVLSRFYEINKGTVLIDGTDIRDYELKVLRKNIAAVLQDVFLFSDTIAGNISLRNKDITQEQISEAAHAIGADVFIDKLPGGYDYNVRERGNTLSSGQRQLVAFIRAMVYNPQILILDEATASIDTETEELLQNAIKKITAGRTSVIIAHRLSTIQHVDKIIVMEQGELKETGTHQELLKQAGLYKKLYDVQFANDMQAD